MLNKMSKWLRIEEDDYVVVVPESDKRPHGTKISETKYELTNQCDCQPKIILGERKGIYEKMIIVHNSFEDKEKIDNILKEFDYKFSYKIK